MGQTSDALRAGIFDVLEFIADVEQQLALHHRAPHVDVPAEIFCKWGDDLYHPETVEFAEAFTARERQVLATFNQAFDDINSLLPQALPPLDAFMQSDAWQRCRDAARRTLDLLGGGRGC
jgi:hypothetical protein